MCLIVMLFVMLNCMDWMLVFFWCLCSWIVVFVIGVLFVVILMWMMGVGLRCSVLRLSVFIFGRVMLLCFSFVNLRVLMLRFRVCFFLGWRLLRVIWLFGYFWLCLVVCVFRFRILLMLLFFFIWLCIYRCLIGVLCCVLMMWKVMVIFVL